MPVKRRQAKERAHRITEEALAAWRTAIEIVEADDHESWADEGGRREDYVEASEALDIALGLRPWQVSPLDVDEDGDPPSHYTRADQIEDYRNAQELRRALVRASKH